MIGIFSVIATAIISLYGELSDWKSTTNYKRRKAIVVASLIFFTTSITLYEIGSQYIEKLKQDEARPKLWYTFFAYPELNRLRLIVTAMNQSKYNFKNVEVSIRNLPGRVERNLDGGWETFSLNHLLAGDVEPSGALLLQRDYPLNSQHFAFDFTVQWEDGIYQSGANVKYDKGTNKFHFYPDKVLYKGDSLPHQTFYTIGGL